MFLYARYSSAFFLLLMLLAACFSGHTVQASPLSGAINNLEVDQIKTIKEMKTALQLLCSGVRDAQENNQADFSLQKIILSKAGECISKIMEFEQQAGTEEIKALFKTTGELIKAVLIGNQQKVENVQETKLDQMEDTAIYFASSEWQQPHYLISLASYWLSWNGYYSSHFYPDADPSRKNVLEESIDGFSRSFIDFKEDSIVVKSLFGRALCYKELRQYDQAIRDINAVIGKIKKEDVLYQRCRYEKILISYLTGNYHSVLRELETFREEAGRKKLSSVMDNELEILRAKTVIAMAQEEVRAKKGNTEVLHRNVLLELSKLIDIDEKQAGELYRYVNTYASELLGLSYDELGPIGYLAIADWYFNQKEYDKAIISYQKLCSSSDRLIIKRMDDIYFRLGYCMIQKKRWHEALSCFESLFKQYPKSSFTGKASCLYYVAAVNSYGDSPVSIPYTTYMDATERYVRYCNESDGKSEAHFQLGKYYQDRGKGKEALESFSRVKGDSPHYAEARYNLVQSHIDEIETLHESGNLTSKDAKKIYLEARKQLEEYQNLLLKQSAGSSRKGLEAQITLLQAKLYIYGPDHNYIEALSSLKAFESRFPVNKNLVLIAHDLRIECYQKLMYFKEAREEINAVIHDDSLKPDLWAFLNDCANRFYEESKKLRNSDNKTLARQNAEIALMIYKQLSSLAMQDTSYERFYDSIQLRRAEILRDENQTTQAKAIYQDQLKRNPDSADAMYHLGLLFEQEEQWEEALATWSEFSKGFKTGSYYWFESRYHTAQVLNKLGRQDKACEITTMIEVLHPTLRDEQFKEKFMVLHADACGKSD